MEEKPTALSAIKQYFKDFGVLKDNPKEFWAIQIINLLDSAAYFSIISTVTVYLDQAVGFGDIHTGYVVTLLTSLVTISLMISGFITDSLGIKKSVILALILQLTSRIGLLTFGLWKPIGFLQQVAITTDNGSVTWQMLLVVLILLLTAPGLAMTITVFQAANKRFSSPLSRSASFNVWYLLMNLGGVVSGLLIRLVRQTFQIDISYIFAFAAAFGIFSIIAAFFLITRETQVGTEPSEIEQKEKKPKQSGFQIFLSLIKENIFWRFIVLMVALLGVRAVFTYMYLLMPKYWIRTIGDQVEMGLLQAINPFFIFVGLILFIPFANKFNVFKMLVFGAMISSVSLLFLVIPWEWVPAPSMAHAYYYMSFAFLVLLSLGEIIWSPKLSEYTAAIAPQGQEGSYLGISQMPWFFAKTTVGLISGHLLLTYCPEGIGKELEAGTVGFWQSPEAMWLILFVWAISGPVIAFIFQKWLTKGAKGLEPKKA